MIAPMTITPMPLNIIRFWGVSFIAAFPESKDLPQFVKEDYISPSAANPVGVATLQFLE